MTRGLVRGKQIDNGTITQSNLGLTNPININDAVTLEYFNNYSTTKIDTLAISNKNMMANSTSGITGVTLACNIPVLQYPVLNSYVEVRLNGIEIENGFNKGCFFSSDGGVTQKDSNQISYNDYLYWDNNIQQQSLDSTDRFFFNYLVSADVVTGSTPVYQNTYREITNTIILNSSFFNSVTSVTLLECSNNINNYIQLY